MLLSPVLGIVALTVASSSPGGVLFRGQRIGQYGKPFEILKFRSMVPAAEGSGTWNVSLKDNRVTRVGRVLRASKLDELPQFLNVLKGEMSLVGPRPELKYYVDMYSEEEAEILRLKPGLTDWASLVNYSQYKEFTAAYDPDEHYLMNIRPLKLHLQRHLLETEGLGQYFRILVWTALNLVPGGARLPKDVRRVVDEFQRERAEAEVSSGE